MPVRTTQTRLKSFELEKLVRTESVKVILEGVLEGGNFLLEEDQLAHEFSAWEAASDEDTLNFEKENLK